MSLPPLVEPAAELTVDEVRRYSRHLIIPDVGMTGQKRLKNAKVLVVGAGGLGSPALLYLAAAGVGTLGIIDFDVVDESNLQRQIIHGQSDVGRPKAELGPGQHPRDQPVRQRRGARGPARLGQRPGDLRRLRPDRRRHRQLRHQVPGQRRVRAARQAVRVGIDLPLRRAGQRVLGRIRPVLPLPVPRAAAAGDGALLRRGRRAGRALRLYRVDPGERGHQAHHRDRRAAGRAADDLRRARDELPHGPGAQGPGVRGLRQEPDGHRPDRLRGVLRRGVARRPPRRPRARPSARRTWPPCWTPATTSSSSTSASRTSTRSSPSPARRSSPRASSRAGPPSSGCRRTSGSCCTARAGPAAAEALAIVKNAGFTDAVHVGGGVLAWINQVDPSLPSY